MSSRKFVPPVVTITRTSRCLASSMHICDVCRASSLVGTIISACMQSFFGSICSNTGIEYAPVLPASKVDFHVFFNQYYNSTKDNKLFTRFDIFSIIVSMFLYTLITPLLRLGRDITAKPRPELNNWPCLIGLH